MTSNMDIDSNSVQMEGVCVSYRYNSTSVYTLYNSFINIVISSSHQLVMQ